jgi:hypothetical protein
MNDDDRPPLPHLVYLLEKVNTLLTLTELSIHNANDLIVYFLAASCQIYAS